LPAFVFQFGYETPLQLARNEEHGWDDESSQWLVIDAPDESAALSWGCEIAERFVRKLSARSWRADRYAYWVEPLDACPWAVGRPAVPVGHMPDFTDWM
jgi:hypothetical protein